MLDLFWISFFFFFFGTRKIIFLHIYLYIYLLTDVAIVIFYIMFGVRSMDGLFDEIIEIAIMDGCCIIQYLISLNICCYLIHIYFRLSFTEITLRLSI